MTSPFKRTPSGWTSQGMAPGCMKPAPNPHRHEVDKLKAENKELREGQAEMLARLEALESKKKGR